MLKRRLIINRAKKIGAIAPVVEENTIPTAIGHATLDVGAVSRCPLCDKPLTEQDDEERNFKTPFLNGIQRKVHKICPA